MILMTPEEQYDSTHAFAILNAYPHDIINKALEEGKNAGTIVRVKGGTDRRVPGRGYNISDKFLSIMTGNLPDRFFAQACGFHKYVMSNDVVSLSPLANSGTVAAVLNLAAHGKVRFRHDESFFCSSHAELEDNSCCLTYKRLPWILRTPRRYIPEKSFPTIEAARLVRSFANSVFLCERYDPNCPFRVR